MFCRRVLTSSAGINVNKNFNMNLNKGDGNGWNNKEVCSNSKEGRRCTEEGYASREEDGEASGQEDGRQKGNCQEARRQKGSCQGCCQTRCQGREARSQEAGRQETRSQEVVYWYQNCPRCVGIRADTARLFLWDGRRARDWCPHRNWQAARTWAWSSRFDTAPGVSGAVCHNRLRCRIQSRPGLKGMTGVVGTFAALVAL